MIRNYLAAALRNLFRNWLYAAIIIICLAIGFAAALLIALFVHDEFSYDRWLPLQERTYLLRTALSETEIAGRAPSYFAATMKIDFTEIEAVARLTPGRASLRRGEIENNEDLFWADPTIFDLLRLPAIGGDLLTALQQPDGVVLTRKMARKYFGRDDPIGESLTFNRQHPMTVTAVLEDLPSNTHLKLDIIASGRAAFSNLTGMDSHPPQDFLINCYTYLRLAPGASGEELERAMPDFLARHKLPPLPPMAIPRFSPKMLLSPLPAVHLVSGLDPFTRPPGDINAIVSLAAVGTLIVLIGGVNFVTLFIARGVHRAKEVAIRKVAGATRSDLAYQFIGEALVYVALGATLAMALVEFCLPEMNALLDRTIIFDWWSKVSYILVFGGFVLLIGIMAGAYPAFVLSSFHPAMAMKSWPIQIGEPNIVRRILVILQFSTLIGLILATVVIFRQTQFALNEGMRLDKDQVYLIRSDCKDAFKDEVRALPGVRGVACSSAIALNVGNIGGPVRLPDGTRVLVARHQVDFGFFEFYGLRPLAGRFFSQDHIADAVSPDQQQPMHAPVVINEAAVHNFNFASPTAAIGKTVWVERYRKDTLPSEIIGVVPDFTMDSIHSKVPPTVYLVDENVSNFLSVRLSGRDIPETLKSIDRLWDKAERPGPANRIFLEQYVQDFYRDVKQESALFAAFSGVALFIGCAGLFGFSAHSAARRTKEIGIRKAMGASRRDILRLLLWQFTKPVLWANVIAWPVAYLAMSHWLQGFAYHIELEPWMFIVSGAVALGIALATVSVHAFLTALENPVRALRYE